MEPVQEPLVGAVFRMTSPRYEDLRKTSEMSRKFPGRFNTTTLGAVYASCDPQTAVREVRRRAQREQVPLSAMHPRSMFVLLVDLPHVVDLTVEGSLEAWGLASADLTGDDFARCQEVAVIATAQGAEAIRWPSATGNGQSLALFIDRLQPGSHVEMAASFEITRPMLGLIEHDAMIGDLIPALAEFARTD